MAGRGTEKGRCIIWIERKWLDKLTALRGKGENNSDMILRLASGGA
jgi:hypothetical protein